MRPSSILQASLVIFCFHAPLVVPAQVKTIPVVFHVLYAEAVDSIGVEQIADALEILNRDYRAQNADTAVVIAAFQDLIADMEVEFCLAGIAPDGSVTSGILYTQTVYADSGGVAGMFVDQWPPHRYFNVWVVRRMYMGTFDEPVAPWVTLLPAQADTMPSRDGVVLLNEYVGSIGTSGQLHARALTHEVGHYLGLQHTWGENDQLFPPQGHVNANCGDDGIDDTPPTRGWVLCPPENQADNCTTGVLENYQNYMEYSYCSVMFTAGQKERVQAVLDSPLAGRNELWTPFNLALAGCQPTSVAESPLAYVAVYPNPCVSQLSISGLHTNGATILLYDTMGRARTYSSTGRAQLDVSDLEPGVYLLRVQASGAARTFIVVKE